MRKDKYNMLIAEKLGIPVGKKEEKKPAEKKRTEYDWCEDLAKEIKAMGHPFSEESIILELFRAVKWARNHPNKEEVYTHRRRKKLVAPIKRFPDVMDNGKFSYSHLLEG